ncbi:MAG: dienelactone hydrolase family protein [Myxococcales bacterium]|nr:dienelactone hydrolase family protein [Myxococcales bacterium]
MSKDPTQTARVTLSVADGTSMGALVTRPADGGPYPALILLQEIFGVNAHIRSVAARLAELGYVVIAPDLFHRGAPDYDAGYDDVGPSFTLAMQYKGDQADADIDAAYQWCASADGVRHDAIGAIGFCMGGKLAFVANARHPLAAAVSFYGGGLAVDRLHLAPSLSGPTLFFWGAQDNYIPASQRRAITDALAALEKPHVAVEFSTTGHGFFCDARGSYDPAAATQAWALTKSFLSLYLG